MQSILSRVLRIAIRAGIHGLLSDAAPALLVPLLEVNDLPLQPNHVLLSISTVLRNLPAGSPPDAGRNPHRTCVLHVQPTPRSLRGRLLPVPAGRHRSPPGWICWGVGSRESPQGWETWCWDGVPLSTGRRWTVSTLHAKLHFPKITINLGKQT